MFGQQPGGTRLVGHADWMNLYLPAADSASLPGRVVTKNNADEHDACTHHLPET